ncbi:hypothetical protein D9M70_585940 [compost metagenome]
MNAPLEYELTDRETVRDTETGKFRAHGQESDGLHTMFKCDPARAGRFGASDLLLNPSHLFGRG